MSPAFPASMTAAEELSAYANTRGYALDLVASTQAHAANHRAKLTECAESGNLVQFGLSQIQLAWWLRRNDEARRLVAWWDAHPGFNPTRLPYSTAGWSAQHVGCNCGHWDRRPVPSEAEARRRVQDETAGLRRRCEARCSERKRAAGFGDDWQPLTLAVSR